MSGMPHKKPSPARSPHRVRVQAHLHLAKAPHPRHPSPRGPLRALFVLSSILVLAFAWFGGTAYFAPPSGWVASDAIAELSSSYLANGIEGYLIAKARLREKVRNGMVDTVHDAERAEAEQVAVYLFPDLLPESHFEKSESFELFLPYIEAIETKARTSAATEAFEALRSEIWNYESASREEPQLTEAGEQLLQLFSQMSRGGS